MKKLVLIILLSCCFLLITFGEVNAFAPLPTPEADETTFAGIIPLTDNTLKLTKRSYQIDLINAYDLPIDVELERQAKVVLSYELTNDDDNQKVKFTLPFISNFEYLPNPIEVKVNDEVITTDLTFASTDFRNNCGDDSYCEFFRYMTNFSNDVYEEAKISEYQFQNEMVGYLYNLSNPKTNRRNTRIETDVIINNKNEIDLIVDWIEHKVYDSKEVAYFFASDVLDVELSSYEVKQPNKRSGYQRTGNPVGEPSLSMEPISLSEYIKRVYLEHITSYPDDFAPFLYQEIDKDINFYRNNFAKKDIEIYLAYPFNQLIRNYYTFGLEFEVDFPKEKTTKIDISYEIPVFCPRMSRAEATEMIFKFINNPGDNWYQVCDTDVTIISGDKVLESTVSYINNENEYQFVIKNDATVDTVRILNTYLTIRNCLLCTSYSYKDLSYFGLLMIAFFIFRRDFMKRR